MKRIIPSEVTAFNWISSNFERARNEVDNEVGDHITSVAKRANYQRPLEPQSTDDNGRQEEAGEDERSYGRNIEK